MKVKLCDKAGLFKLTAWHADGPEVASSPTNPPVLGDHLEVAARPAADLI